MIFAHFSIELLIIFLLIHKSLSYVEEMNQWFVPTEAPSFLLLTINSCSYRVNKLPHSFSALYLRHCLVRFLHLVYGNGTSRWGSGLQEGTLSNTQWVYILQEVHEENLKPEKPFSWHLHRDQRPFFLSVESRTLGRLGAYSLPVI